MDREKDSRRVPFRVAIAGCGRMGRLHAERLAADGRARIAALFDIDPAAADGVREAAAREATVCRRFQEMVDQVPVDAALICTPTQFHFEQAAAYLSRGVAVLCEKPLGGGRSEIVELIANAGRTGATLTVAYQRRTWSVYRTLRRLVQSGEFGPVRAVCSHNIENWQQTIAGTWRDDPQANFGGFVGDAGSHKIDAAFHVTGLLPTDVFARCDRCGSRVETTASISALLTGGVPLTMDFVGHAQHFAELLSVQCAEADLLLRDRGLWIARGGAESEPVPLSEADSNPAIEFLNVLANGGENFAPPECALPVFDFTAAVVESARTGRSIELGGSAAGPAPK